MIHITRLDSDPGRLVAARIRNRFSEETDGDCRQAVTAILSRIRKEGDAALLAYCRQFDCPTLDPASLKVSAAEFAQAEEEVDDAFRATLHFAVDRIRAFHEREQEDSWMLTRDDGAITGRLVRPVDSAGLVRAGRQRRVDASGFLGADERYPGPDCGRGAAGDGHAAQP
jgi:histidinol dehydrogenase